MPSVKDTGPLTWNVPIIDTRSGRPTPEFQRRWEQQRTNNSLIGNVTLGSGVPTGTPEDGAEYVNVSTTPYNVYFGNGGSWHLAGGGITQLTGDVTAGPGAGSQVATLAASGVTATSYGSAFRPPILTVDLKGRITAASTSTPITLYTGDLNSIISVAGTYAFTDISTSATNKPGTAAGLAQTFSRGSSSANQWQLFFPFTQSALYMRLNTGGVWGAWTLFANDPSTNYPGDANFTTTGATNNNIIFDTPLTSNRLCSFNFTNAVIGSKARVRRSVNCTGAFTLTVGTTAPSTLAILSNPEDWVDVVYDGSTWIVTGSGSALGKIGANPTATASDVAVNGTAATYMRSDGAPAIQKASSSQFGLVKVDGTTVTASGGVISATGGISAANPTATASDVAVNGVASTFMRSDAAPLIQKASSSQFGLVKVDGTTVTASGGVISAATTGINRLYAINTATATNTGAIAGRGALVVPFATFSIDQAFFAVTPPSTLATYKCYVVVVDASNVITSIVTSSNTLSPGSVTAAQMLVFTLTSTASLTANTRYGILCYRTDSTGTASSGTFAGTGEALPAPIYPLATFLRQTTILPTVGDTLAAGANPYNYGVRIIP